MIETGSLVKYVDNVRIKGRNRMRAIGKVTSVEPHELFGQFIRMDILVQNEGCGFTLAPKNYGCGINSLKEVSDGETALAVLSGRVR